MTKMQFLLRHYVKYIVNKNIADVEEKDLIDYKNAIDCPNSYKKLDALINALYKDVPGIKKVGREWNISEEIFDELAWNYEYYNSPFSRAVRGVYKPHLFTKDRWEKIIEEEFNLPIDEFYKNSENNPEIGYAISTIKRTSVISNIQ